MDGIRRLTPERLQVGVEALCERDADLARSVDRFGAPPLWGRRPGFATLVRIVLEQQVSLSSAKATYGRLRAALGSVTAHRVARLEIAELRDLGITRQKADYCSNLARLITTGRLDLRQVARASDTEARQLLCAVRGIGPWTADIYLLMALRRPDVWPDGDLALAAAARRVKRLRKRPSVERLRRIAGSWKPWRGVAARILWHSYLSERR
ncbi:MAG: DNA-3-methyladenine glycosylase 2 family protein [Gemmatimonadota bacterium]|nr:MAG: DNA-3-methyladenine glycosylase 2 family protein [Gemmatimonadota bacterium]